MSFEENAPTYPVGEMLSLAQEVAELVKPYSYRTMVVGSIRRGRTYVKDIELLVQPLMHEPQTSLFEVPEARKDKAAGESQVYLRILELVKDGTFDKRLNQKGSPIGVGQNNAYLVYKERPLDVFSALPGQSYGLKCAIYTGPREFSKKLVTPQRQGGHLPDGWSMDAGKLYNENRQPVVCDTEEEFFRAIGLEYIAPEHRMSSWKPNR